MKKNAHFTASRKQLHRMAAIVALLKAHTWVKMKKILNDLDATEFLEGAYLACGNRTIQRDIKALQTEYHAPIEYSKKEAAYTLLDKEWSFQVPALLNADELLAVVIGGKLCRDIFPPGISRRVTRAVNEVIRSNDSDELSSELMDSLKVLTDATAVVSEAIFLTVFEAWRMRHQLRISYADRNGKSAMRDIEPHTLVFNDMRWSIKGFCQLRQQPRTFHLSQITAAMMLDKTFIPSKEIIDSVTQDSFLDFEKVLDVEIWLNEKGRYFASVHTLHSKQSFVKQGKGAYRMYVPAVSLEKLVPWILQQQGNARTEAPAAAVEAVRKAIRNLADVCQAYDPEEIRQKTAKASEKSYPAE